MHHQPLLSVAPMLDWTDRHYRYFLRLISKHTLLYTEMITTGALIHGDRARFLAHDTREYPLALQLGGSDPHAMATSARFAEDAGYNEVNINVGCPSDRVQNGRFGACLMLEPKTVADCIKAMKDVVQVPVTVKCRIGVDQHDSYAELVDFVAQQQEAGCDRFIVHARKAWLKGLSPKENRTIPPLRYDIVFALKRDFPKITISINGGIETLPQAQELLTEVDGVMIGRAAYHNPWIFQRADQLIYGDNHPLPEREQILEELVLYAEQQCSRGTPLAAIARHVLGLYHGEPGARAWRRTLCEQMHQPDASPELLRPRLRM